MELIGDRSAFDWIAQNLDREGFAVSRLLPPVLAAYCKILHPIHVDLSVADRSLSWDEAASATTWVDRISAPDLTKEIVRDLVSGGTLERGAPDEAFPRARVLWRELAAQYAVNYTPQITEEAFTQIFPGRSWPRYLVGPNEGTLDEESCRRLIEILAPFTGTQKCFFYYDLINLVRLHRLGPHVHHRRWQQRPGLGNRWRCDPRVGPAIARVDIWRSPINAVCRLAVFWP